MTASQYRGKPKKKAQIKGRICGRGGCNAWVVCHPFGPGAGRGSGPGERRCGPDELSIQACNATGRAWEQRHCLRN